MKLQKDIEKIRGIISNWEEKKDALQEKIERREEIFGDHSEKWQESEKGQQHQEETDRLNDFLLELDDKFSELVYALEEIEILINENT